MSKKKHSSKVRANTVEAMFASAPTHIVPMHGMTRKQADKHIRSLGYDPKLARTEWMPLTGDRFTGTCISCLTPTDTALCLWGEAEWHLAFLQRSGIPKRQVSALLEQEFNCDPGKVPVGVVLMPCRICQRCAGRVSSSIRPQLLLPGGPLPQIAQDGIFPVPDKREVESWDTATPGGYGTRLVEGGPRGSYLLPPVILDEHRGAQWGLTLVRLISKGHLGSPSVGVIPSHCTDIPTFEQELAALSTSMSVPVWPHQEPGRVDAC